MKQITAMARVIVAKYAKKSVLHKGWKEIQSIINHNS